MSRRIEALRAFKREYFHALRNGLTADEAGDQALARVKKDVLLNLKDEKVDELTRLERWGRSGGCGRDSRHSHIFQADC